MGEVSAFGGARSDDRRITAATCGEPAESGIRVHVLGHVMLTTCGVPVTVGASCQRLLVLLALNGGQINRVHGAGVLWPEVTGERANANLRSVLWRLQRCCSCDVLEASFTTIRFTPEVSVDITPVFDIARRLLDRSAPPDIDTIRRAMRCNFTEDIAPELCDWEWLDVERERYRQLRLHALEALSAQLIAAKWYGAAIDAALEAIHADPFRETAHQLLVRAHLAEGNQLEARRRYDAYRDLLRKELDLEPSEQFIRLLHGTKVHRAGVVPLPVHGSM
jgi:DNA-binding SARP family transcriptional activator